MRVVRPDAGAPAAVEPSGPQAAGRSRSGERGRHVYLRARRAAPPPLGHPLGPGRCNPCRAPWPSLAPCVQGAVGKWVKQYEKDDYPEEALLQLLVLVLLGSCGKTLQARARADSGAYRLMGGRRSVVCQRFGSGQRVGSAVRFGVRDCVHWSTPAGQVSNRRIPHWRPLRRAFDAGWARRNGERDVGRVGWQEQTRQRACRPHTASTAARRWAGRTRRPTLVGSWTQPLCQLGRFPPGSGERRQRFGPCVLLAFRAPLGGRRISWTSSS